MKQTADIAAFEGLIFSTAARYAPILDDDLEDIQQILRVKVWKALDAFDPQRARRATTREERQEIIEKFVFSCVRNQVKDLLQSQDRRNTARGGMLDSIDAVPEERTASFEANYLCESDEQVFACVDDSDFELPSTLTDQERQVVQLLVLNFSRAEIARLLGIPQRRVRTAHDSVRMKMADWKPGAAASPSPRLASGDRSAASSAPPFARAA